MEKEEWFERIGAENTDHVNEFVYRLLEFSKNPEYSRLFNTCGLYSVGSSVMPDKDEFNDIDITLVGLDFRAVFDYDDSIDSFCLSKLEESDLIDDLVRFIERNTYYAIQEMGISPFAPYNKKENINYITARALITPELNATQIDFLIHGENLFVPYWKENFQKPKNWPYIILHEWEKADSKNWFERFIPPGKMNLALPGFIDKLGKKRADILKFLS